jgi:hypothetical protein
LGTRYGTQILWPVILVQQRVLRGSLAYLDHSRKHQAITYALEAVVEDALTEDFGRQGAAAVERWQRLDLLDRDLLDKLYSRGAIFCSWTKAERKRRFLDLLDSFHPMYDLVHSQRPESAAQELLSPRDLAAWEHVEWPDPRW